LWQLRSHRRMSGRANRRGLSHTVPAFIRSSLTTVRYGRPPICDFPGTGALFSVADIRRISEIGALMWKCAVSLVF